MKKNAGFTLVEIIVSFTLTMVIVLFLFQLVITLKQIYTNNFVKSNLVLKQSNISRMINSDLISSYLGNVTNVANTINCYNITFEYGSRNICYDNSTKTISYNDYEFQLDKNVEIDSKNVLVGYDTTNSILKINIPVTYPDIDGDFGIKIAYLS